MPYPGLWEWNQLYFNLVDSYKELPDSRRHRLSCLRTYGAATDGDAAWLDEMQEDFLKAKADFIENPESKAAVQYLLDFYYSFQDYIMFFCLHPI